MSDSHWSTQNNLLIHVPDYIVENEMMSYSSGHTDGFQFVSTRVETSYNFSRVLRFVSVFLAFFLLDNTWLAIPISLASFAVGYLYLFQCDYFPFCSLVDFFGLIYQVLFRFLLIPVAVLIFSFVTKQYLFVAIYLLSLLSSFIFRFVFDHIYIKHFKRVYGVIFTPVDSKVSHILYRYSAHRRFNSYRSYFIYLISMMSSDS